MIDIKKALRKFAPTFLHGRDANLNEADTVLRLCKFFEDVLGFDAIEDISREANLKNKFVDVCLKVDGKIRLLVEAKAAAVQLRDRHIEQAQAYAAHNNYQWVLLTNGVDWNLYHLTFSEGIEFEVAFTASLATAESVDFAAEKLGLLHKRSIEKGQLNAFWETSTALGPASIGMSLFTDEVLSALRRQVRKDTGHLIDQEEIASAIHQMFTVDAREQLGPMRIRRKRRLTKDA